MFAFLFMRIAATLVLGLEIAELAFHPSWLPLCGGTAEQLVVVFILTYVVVEMVITGKELLSRRDKEDK